MAKTTVIGDRFSHVTDPHIEKIRQIQYNKKQTEYQYFPEEYFSGSDVTIYFGDTWVDELTALSFSLYEPVKPIHGYASYTWDAVARGARTVEGEFRIAFKEAGYLQVILEHLAVLGDKAKPRLAYLMGDESVPDWVSGVKENIEDTLYRWFGNKDAKGKTEDKKVKEKYLDVYEWNTLKHVRLDSSMTDKGQKNTAGRERGFGTTGAITQLQKALMAHGIKWGPWRYTEGANKGKLIGKPPEGYDNHGYTVGPEFAVHAKGQKMPSKAIAKYKPAGNWRLCRRYDANNHSYQGIDYRSIREAEMQRRLGNYPGDNSLLKNAMGGKHGTIDGRYGGGTSKKGTAAGVDIFQDLCLAPKGKETRAPNGNYLTDFVYQELKKPFDVTGVFDTPTRIAVMLFQSQHGLKMDGVVGEKTRKALSPMATKTKTIPGKEVSLYAPDKLFEPRAAQYEKEVWGRASSKDEDHKRRTFFYYRFNDAEYLRKHGFDIYITYGPYPEAVIKDKGQMASSLPGNKAGFNTTVKAIRNVQLTGVRQILDISGVPIEEAYSFIAKDLD